MGVVIPELPAISPRPLLIHACASFSTTAKLAQVLLATISLESTTGTLSDMVFELKSVPEPIVLAEAGDASRSKEWHSMPKDWEACTLIFPIPLSFTRIFSPSCWPLHYLNFDASVLLGNSFTVTSSLNASIRNGKKDAAEAEELDKCISLLQIPR